MEVVVARGREGDQGVMVLMGAEFHFCKMKSSGEGRGGGCTAVNVFKATLSCSLNSG